MSRIFKLYLIVESPPKSDNDKLVIRIYEIDKPEGIEWGDYIGVSMDNRNWIVCKLEKAGPMGIHKIFINRTLRQMLNRNLTGTLGARKGIPCHFYINKVPSWKVPLYIMRYHPNDGVRENMRLRIYSAIGAVMASAIITVLVSLIRC